MSKAQVFFKSFGKTIYWLSINTLFGLSPLLIAFIISIASPKLEVSIIKILDEGSILFFCAAISGATMVDYIFSKYKFPKYIEAGLYLTPPFILLVGGIIFTHLHFHDDVFPEFNNCILIQNVIIFLSLFYCGTIKIIHFIKEY